MRVTIVNPVWKRDLLTPAEVLDAFHTLTGWAEAVRAAGVESVTSPVMVALSDCAKARLPHTASTTSIRLPDFTAVRRRNSYLR